MEPIQPVTSMPVKQHTETTLPAAVHGKHFDHHLKHRWSIKMANRFCGKTQHAGCVETLAFRKTKFT